MQGIQDSVQFVWAKPTEDLATLDPTYEGDTHGMPHHANIGFSEERMSYLYNVADVFVSSSMGESFCLPVIEAQACGVPCIATAFSTGKELIGEPFAGALARVKAFITHPAVLGDMAEVDEEYLAGKLLDTYTSSIQRKEWAANALTNANDYSWCKILPQWNTLIEKVIKEGVLRTDYKRGRLGI